MSSRVKNAKGASVAAPPSLTKRLLRARELRSVACGKLSGDSVEWTGGKRLSVKSDVGVAEMGAAGGTGRSARGGVGRKARVDMERSALAAQVQVSTTVVQAAHFSVCGVQPRRVITLAKDDDEDR